MAPVIPSPVPTSDVQESYRAGVGISTTGHSLNGKPEPVPILQRSYVLRHQVPHVEESRREVDLTSSVQTYRSGNCNALARYPITFGFAPEANSNWFRSESLGRLYAQRTIH